MTRRMLFLGHCCYYLCMSHFIFVRHGQSQANADGVIADAHSPLTTEGIAQARQTAGEIRTLGIDTIVVSPYLRAQQTAETIAGELGIDLAHIQIIEELRERGLGELEGRPKSHDSLWYYTRDDAEGIETARQLYDRMAKCISTLKALPQSGTALVVGHSISGFYLQQIASARTLDSFDSPLQLKNAGFVEFALV